MLLMVTSSRETPSRSILAQRTSLMKVDIDMDSCATAARSPIEPKVIETGSIFDQVSQIQALVRLLIFF